MDALHARKSDFEKEARERRQWNSSAQTHLLRCSLAGQRWIRQRVEQNRELIQSAGMVST
jgi:hypothetical protein